nr:glycoside hydrolase family 13 protein [Anaerolineae bacterium]
MSLKTFGRWWALVLVVLALSVTAAAQDAPESGLLHDSRDDLFRTPVGAVPFGTSVTVRLRALEGEIDAANVRVYNTRTQSQSVLPLSLAAVTPEGYALWETTLEAGDETTVLYYRFIVRKGARVWYYEDDTLTSGEYRIADKGGVGAAMDVSVDASYQIGVYDPEFYTPEWMRNAIIYQIFPDRFRNGDRANDPASGSETFYGELDLIYQETWNAPPVDGRTRTTESGLGYFNSDFFGGDFAGITEKLDYLQSLGVTAIYLNPIFEARSNHRYDTVDFKAVDPILGSLEDFQTLVREAEARGIVLILDGVFNHMSSDSVLFDRYERFEGDLGACESVDSEYRDWFFFEPPTGPEPAACVDDGAGNTYYVSWFGFDSIPKIDNTKFGPRAYFFRGEDSVARLWGNEGIGGWRLDVGGDIDNGRDADNTYWEGFRRVVRSVNPEAVIIGEEWNDSTEWLLGDEWDSVMNYRFRRAIIGLVNGSDFADNDGRIVGLTPAEFETTIRSVEEDYPPMAYRAMMNLLGSHDTARLLYALGDDVESLKLAASVLYSLPGAPTIYYGDEIAIDAPNIGGQDDPYNRAPYPWPDESGDHYDAPNEDVLAHYQALGALRKDNPALREGAMVTIEATDEVLSFVRLDAEAGNAALVVVNVSDEPVSYALPAGFAAGVLPAGLSLSPAFGTEETVSSDGGAAVTVAARSTAIWTVTADAATFMAAQQAPAVTAEAATGQVTVAWDAMDGAAAYHVFRSPVAVGGYERITSEPVVGGEYIDTSVVNGFVYHYAVAPANAAGVTGALVTAAAPVVPSYAVDAV